MDASIRSRSAIITVAIHAALFLILFFTLMKTSIPPFPESDGGGGRYISIGTLADASGDVQPMSEENKTQPVPVVKQQQAPEEKVVTQETEEAKVAYEEKKVKPKENVKPVVSKPVERKPDEKMLYHGTNAPSTSQGNTKGKGDQGQENGGPTGYVGSPGTGTEGSGGGSGNTYGPGHGSGPPGIDFHLTGRNMIKAPSINDQSQETGKVVVEITVNKNGDVTFANPGVRGTTASSPHLFKLAKEAAMQAKFSAMENGAEIQTGTITIVFVVQ
jgi:outer membrane biosynthesis protein TonB